ncbi:MAG: FAD-binding oxidoreductase [Gemmataceae bacterium]|nr:FAD-binding oxidoreductase [Gemmataceae bacterium]
MTDVVIGGGFFGLFLAEQLARRGTTVVLCERGPALMARASFHNQARVHNGCHYPRSLLTAARSRVNAPRFRAEFADAIDASFTAVYAIARRESKVSAEQFAGCLRRVGVALKLAPPAVARLFAPAYIEAAFVTDEAAFNADILREIMVARVAAAGVDVRLNTEVTQVAAESGGIAVETTGGTLHARQVFCCGYAAVNGPGVASGLPAVPLKHELTELALVDVPEDLRHVGITVMDGPFFSCMPFPARGCHSLSHVRYTPHGCWSDGPAGYRPADDVLAAADRATAYPYMIRDAARYVPALAGASYRESLWEVKTLLPRSETDDSRPILFAPNHGLQGYHLVLGGKIDNVYDAWDVIEQMLERGGPS